MVDDYLVRLSASGRTDEGLWGGLAFLRKDYKEEFGSAPQLFFMGSLLSSSVLPNTRASTMLLDLYSKINLFP